VSDGRRGVVVTGGAGFIGSELVRQLVARGDQVVAIDNLVNGKRENLADVLSDGVTLLERDIRDLRAIAPSLREARVVYHLACLGVRHSVHSPRENHEVNAPPRSTSWPRAARRACRASSTCRAPRCTARRGGCR
jgi:UDP-glucose 4-epimerase